jgi:hypothetical protein
MKGRIAWRRGSMTRGNGLSSSGYPLESEMEMAIAIAIADKLNTHLPCRLLQQALACRSGYCPEC